MFLIIVLENNDNCYTTVFDVRDNEKPTLNQAWHGQTFSKGFNWSA